MSEFQD